MLTLYVSIEKKDVMVRVGTICGNSADDAVFSYSEEYLKDPDPHAISLSLPLQPDPFDSRTTRCFFDGLLPEGFTRRTLAQMMHRDENDYLSILSELGNECIGAVRITEDDTAIPRLAYEALSEQEIKQLAEEGTTRSAELVTRTHLSLTGASGKVGLYYDDQQDRWYLPIGDAPSTHIVKQGHIRLERIVANEQLCLLTARILGLYVPDSFIINLGNNRDEDVLFATRRFDRPFRTDGANVDGLPLPSRLHQEDLAQALGIAAADKYETEKKGYLSSIFKTLRIHSADPLRDQLKLWDYLVFDYLVGNTDNHIKNFSLLYSRDFSSLRLAPAYDILSTSAYESSTRDMAFYIGNDCSLDAITRESFEAAAKEAGLGRPLALKHVDDLAARFETALEQAAGILKSQGFDHIDNLRSRIMELGGIASLR